LSPWCKQGKLGDCKDKIQESSPIAKDEQMSNGAGGLKAGRGARQAVPTNSVPPEFKLRLALLGQ
jgi:hypothetical protein